MIMVTDKTDFMKVRSEVVLKSGKWTLRTVANRSWKPLEMFDIKEDDRADTGPIGLIWRD